MEEILRVSRGTYGKVNVTVGFSYSEFHQLISNHNKRGHFFVKKRKINIVTITNHLAMVCRTVYYKTVVYTILNQWIYRNYIFFAELIGV